MIGYVCIGTNDLEKSASFYDALLAEMGAKRVMEMENFVGWGKDEKSPMVLLIKPNDGKPATVGNGMMVSLAAESHEQINAVHAKALELGGKDEGAPGERMDGFYAGYFRDLEGNKLAAFKSG